MNLRMVPLYLALVALGAGLPLAWGRLHTETLCAPDDAACLLGRAAELLHPREGAESLLYGEDAHDRREAARARLAEFGAPTARPAATVADLTAALRTGALPATDEDLWPYIIRALQELRVADAATARATLDLFEAEADVISQRAPDAFAEMLVWLAVNDIDRLARLLRPDEIDRSGGEFDGGAEFVRASLLVHDCARRRAAGEDPAIGLNDRMEAAALRFSMVNARDMLALAVILHCGGAAAAEAAVQEQLSWISADNAGLRADLAAGAEAQARQDAVERIAWASYLLSAPYAAWLSAEGRAGEMRAVFDRLQPARIAAPLAEIGPQVADLFDRQFLTWAAFVDLLGRSRLHVAPADLALAYVATEFDPQFRSDTRDRRDVERALALIEAAWPSGAAQAALWRLGQAATNASETEVLRLTTLLRLVTLDRSMGCPLPEPLMAEVRDRVEGQGFGGGRMSDLDRAELALAAVAAIRAPQPDKVTAGYLCIQPQLTRLWQYAPRHVDLLNSRMLPIRE